METTISNLLRSLAEAIRPFLGLDTIGAVDPGDIEGLDELVETAVDDYFQNDTSILTDSSFDPETYGLLTNDDFDPSNFDLLDATDIEYLIDVKVDEAVGAAVEAAVEEAMEDALVVQPAGLYTSEEFLDAVEAAVRATLVGTTWTVQANVTQPEVHLDGHSGDDVVVAGV
jgi:hypothetical protein